MRNEPLAKHTSWRVGGVADNYFAPSDVENLRQFLQQLPESESITWLGLGSNVLISDEGIRGTVIHLKNSLNSVELLDNNTITAQSGLSCAKLARFAAKHNLEGAEFFAGIPGTVGGALAMNAGAFGSETWEYIVEVTTINNVGKINIRTAKDYNIAYRTVIHNNKNEWFIAAKMQFLVDSSKNKTNIKDLLRKRNASQPIGFSSCGSVFKNPPGDYAGRLIEAANLKGYTIGGAMVSEKHCNFIINTGNASANDMVKLINHIQETVKAKFNVDLQTEVRFLGF